MYPKTFTTCCLMPIALTALAFAALLTACGDGGGVLKNDRRACEAHQSCTASGSEFESALISLQKAVDSVAAIEPQLYGRNYETKKNGWHALLQATQYFSESDKNREPLKLLAKEPAQDIVSHPFSGALTTKEHEALLVAVQSSSQAETLALEVSSYDYCVSTFDPIESTRWSSQVIDYFVLLSRRTHALHALGMHDEAMDSAILCFELAMKTHGGANLAASLVTTKIRQLATQSLMRVSESGDLLSMRKEMVDNAIRIHEEQRIEMPTQSYLFGEVKYAAVQGSILLEEAQDISDGVEADVARLTERSRLLQDMKRVLALSPAMRWGTVDMQTASKFWEEYVAISKGEGFTEEVASIVNKIAAYEATHALLYTGLVMRSLDLNAASGYELEKSIEDLPKMYEWVSANMGEETVTIGLQAGHPLVRNTSMGEFLEYEYVLLGRDE